MLTPLLLNVRLFTEQAFLPSMTRHKDGYYLKTSKTIRVLPGQMHSLNLGIALEIPLGTLGRISSIPETTAFTGVHVISSFVPHGFTGSVNLTLHNPTRYPQVFVRGDNVALLHLEKTFCPTVVDLGLIKEEWRLKSSQRITNVFY